MMAPTLVMRDGEVVAGLGSGGSNRIRSAILQTVLRMIVDGMSAADAVRAPRVHFEAGAVQAEPGVDEAALLRLEKNGFDDLALAAPEPLLRRGAGGRQGARGRL